MSNKRSFLHVNILVDDLEPAVVFYRDELGLKTDDTPEQGMPSQFFRLDNGSQIHMNEVKDIRSFRAHFALDVDNFSAVFRRMKEIGAIDLKAWGNVRKLPGGKMQMFVRDPSDNLVEINSCLEEIIDPDILADDIVDAEESIFVWDPSTG